MVFGVVSHKLVQDGRYPIASVHFNIITARELHNDFGAAFNYFQRAALTYGSNPAILNTASAKQEIQRATLEKIIVDSLIFKELRKRVPESEYQEVADRKISQFLEANPKTQEAAKTLYNLSLEDFKERILLPQSYKEILQGRMTLDGTDFNNWLQNAKSDAKVAIFYPNLKWEEGQLKLN